MKRIKWLFHQNHTLKLHSLIGSVVCQSISQSIIPSLILQALYDICQKVYQAQPQEQGGKRTYPAGSGQVKGQGSVVSGAGGATKAGHEKPFDHMNNIVANMLLNLTR